MESGNQDKQRVNSNDSSKSDVSYGPDPSDAATRKSVLRNVAGYIIITEFCERLTYYGLAGSLVLFFQVSSIIPSTIIDAQF